MALYEADTQAKLIDPNIHASGWTGELFFREQTALPIEIMNGKPRKRGKSHTDYTLRRKSGQNSQRLAVALIGAKSEDLPPTHDLEHVKHYAASKRLKVPFVYSTNGCAFIKFEKLTGLICSPRLMSEFHLPEEQKKYK